MITALILACSDPGGPAEPSSRDFGVLGGTVADDRGGPVAGAAVSACHTFCVRVSTAEDGSFVLGELEPGLYDLKIEALDRPDLAAQRVPVEVAADSERVLRVQLPALAAAVPLGVEISPAPGLTLSAWSGSATSIFGDPVDAVAAAALSPVDLAALDGLPGEAAAAYVIAPFQALLEPPIEARFAAGRRVVVARADGWAELVSDGDAVSIEELGTFVVLE